MAEDRKPLDQSDLPDSPGIASADWDAIASGAIQPDSVPENGDIRYDSEVSGELAEEDDDNPYQESDEALPDDGEERAIAKNPSKEENRFDDLV